MAQLIHGSDLRISDPSRNENHQPRSLDVGSFLLPGRLSRLAEGSCRVLRVERGSLGGVWVENWVEGAIDVLLDDFLGLSDVPR